MMTSISDDTPERSRPWISGKNRWLNTTSLWMGAASLIAFVLAVIALAIFGASGTSVALRVTARWSFLLFWLAYAGGAMAKLWGPGYPATE